MNDMKRNLHVNGFYPVLNEIHDKAARGGDDMQDRVAIVFDPYHHNAEILFVGEEDECLVIVKDWYNDVFCGETPWEKLEWRREGESLIQNIYDPKIVIGKSTILESF